MDEQVQRREFDTPMPDPERLAWCDWFEAHGVDPRDVPTPGWVIRDPQAGCITFLAYVLNSRGELVVDEDRRSVMTETRRVHLGRAPRPWPDTPDP